MGKLKFLSDKELIRRPTRFTDTDTVFKRDVCRRQTECLFCRGDWPVALTLYSQP